MRISRSWIGLPVEAALRHTGQVLTRPTAKPDDLTVPGGDWRHAARRAAPSLAAVTLIHLLAALLWVSAGVHAPLVWGLGVTAYLLGLRHAWDADHIAVIDNTARHFLQLGRPAYGIGLVFSLGHSAVVVVLCVVVTVIGQALLGAQGRVGTFGGWVGPLVAGVYLLSIAVLNLSATVRWAQGHAPGHVHGGLLSRLISPLTAMVSRPWHVLALGFLMGLGFDTASEVAALALAGNAAQHALSWAAVLSLPLLFMAGMTLLDTLDGAAMTHAYAWALNQPQARRRYNLLVTGLSGGTALVIGVISLGQWAGAHFPAAARSLAAVRDTDVSPLGAGLSGAVLALFLAFRWREGRRAGNAHGAEPRP